MQKECVEKIFNFKYDLPRRLKFLGGVSMSVEPSILTAAASVVISSILHPLETTLLNKKRSTKPERESVDGKRPALKDKNRSVEEGRAEEAVKRAKIAPSRTPWEPTRHTTEGKNRSGVDAETVRGVEKDLRQDQEKSVVENLIAVPPLFKLVFLSVLGITLLSGFGAGGIAFASDEALTTNQQTVFEAANFVWKMGVGAIFGLLGGKIT